MRNGALQVLRGLLILGNLAEMLSQHHEGPHRDPWVGFGIVFFEFLAGVYALLHFQQDFLNGSDFLKVFVQIFYFFKEGGLSLDIIAFDILFEGRLERFPFQVHEAEVPHRRGGRIFGAKLLKGGVERVFAASVDEGLNHLLIFLIYFHLFTT